MTKKEYFAETLINILNRETGCDIQYKGCPCGTCVQNFATKELELSPTLAHAFWLILLSIRGDYTREQIEDGLVTNLYVDREVITNA